jgi:hypothetical protein
MTIETPQTSQGRGLLSVVLMWFAVLLAAAHFSFTTESLSQTQLVGQRGETGTGSHDGGPAKQHSTPTGSQRLFALSDVRQLKFSPFSPDNGPMPAILPAQDLAFLISGSQVLTLLPEQNLPASKPESSKARAPPQMS